MMQLSKPTAERLQRWSVTLILILGAVPIALPFCWLVLSSLKTQDHVLTNTPEWLPWADRHYVTLSDGTEQNVTVVGRGRSADLGVWRVKPAAQGDAAWFAWPERDLRATPVTGYAARIGRLQRTVTAPQRTDTAGMVRVEQIGTQRRIPVQPTDELRVDTERQLLAHILGQVVPIAITTPAADAPSTSATLTLLAPSGVFAIAASQVTEDAGRAFVTLPEAHVRLPVEVVARLSDAGVYRVRLLAGEAVPQSATDVLSAAELRQQLDAQPQIIPRYWLLRDGQEVEVNPTRFGPDDRPVEVALPGRQREWVVPAADVSSVTHTQSYITWLGQRLTVQVQHDVQAPAGQVALRVDAPDDAVYVAADRVQHARWLAPQWANYINVFRAEPLHRYVLNTLFITALSIIGNVLSCGLVGYAFARLQFRGRNALFALVLATMMLPGTITFLPTYILYVKIGWLDSFYPLIVPTFVATSAFFIFLYRQYFMTIPVDLEDAARIDGCGPLATFWQIMLPMARPAVVTVTVFTFMAAWNDFMGPLLYINTDEYQTLAYGLYNFKSSFGYKFPHYMMAASTMMMLPTLIIFFIAQNAFMRGVVVSGVKG